MATMKTFPSILVACVTSVLPLKHASSKDGAAVEMAPRGRGELCFDHPCAPPLSCIGQDMSTFVQTGPAPGNVEAKLLSCELACEDSECPPHEVCAPVMLD